MKNKQIIFVCTGNTCRSPMAEVILKSKIKLAEIKGIKVSSAGLCAHEGKPMNEFSKIALKKLGYRTRAFKSKPLTPELVKKADLIICMTEEHKAYLNGLSKAVTMDEITGLGNIADPYGLGLPAYIKASQEIESACDVIIREIKG